MKSLKLVVIFSVFLNFMCVFGQKNFKDSFHTKITYEFSYSLDSTDIETKKQEDMILFIGANTSVYSSRAKTFKGEPILKGNSGSTPKTALTDFHYVIVKNRSLSKQFYTLQIVNDFFYYPQELSLFNWTLKSETKEIKGYKVQKAITSFANRNYEAWFTFDITIAEGPYKFNGLPGLILELYDTEKHFHFKLKGLENLNPKRDFSLRLKDYIKTTKSKLLETWIRYKSDPFNYVKNPNITISPEVHKRYVESFKEKLSKENNHLEKN